MISHCTCYCWKAPGHLRDSAGVSAILFVCSFADPTLFPPFLQVISIQFLSYVLIIIIIIEGLSLLQSIPPTTADKQTQAQKRRGSRSRKLLGAKAKSYRLKN